MIHASFRMKFGQTKLTEARDVLIGLLDRTKASPGCLGCNIYQEVLDLNALLFEEWWETETDLYKRLCSDSFWHLLLVMDMAAKPPEISFEFISETTGIETIEKARSLTPNGETP